MNDSMNRLAGICTCSLGRSGSGTCDCTTVRNFRVKAPTNTVGICSCTIGRSGNTTCDCTRVDIMGNTSAGFPHS